MYSSSSSSSSYSDSGYSEIQLPHNYNHHKEDQKSTKRPPTFHSKLHLVSKIPAKDKKIMKKPIAPWPRTPPKVYNVAPIHFRDVVQKLTSAPQFQPRRLHEEAPLPHEWFPLAEHTVNIPSSAEEEQQRSVEKSSFGELMIPFALTVSPPSLCMDFIYSLCP